MAASTTEEIRQLNKQAVEFTPTMSHHRPRRPSTFLSLAPSTSDSYPRAQRPRQPLTPEALAAVTKQDGAASGEAMKRRSSSLSSDASKFRFLKIGPVHWGEHQDDHKGDYYELAVE
ncbi:hypothetical protein MYCTH_2313333 [Thermothelomyces thermophilus ATCC 42464]|uniref:Uncharacterized protein n=1 Tax=Thermothelomyces thermophilus (strain ATCC 42464 / BCRC 31852 / DSM 1799) TaxID=573729 RepID=G2Q1R4_THET4|nr:uncharacterized protein MYCTH_2313333 [Thermothelomyces thermophilus ATCC 42464]AEO53348.1 hypothetical protein MYCTH_2313333 [Thermothelomyces thermophilus ATCC 42464]